MKHETLKKVYIKTYGCQSNAYDSDRMMDVVSALGYQATETPEDADLAILNTCHIREKAEDKVFSDLGRLNLHKRKRLDGGQDMLIGVAGCVAQGAGSEILRRAPYVDLVFGPQTYHRLPQMLAQAQRERDRKSEPQKKGPGRGILHLDFPVESKFDFLPEEHAPRGPSAFVAIQEGCDKFCTYCVVPYTRGIEFSRPVPQILKEAERLVRQGSQELTLLGQNVNAYHGEDGGEERALGHLIRRIADCLEPLGLKRLRYTTSYPRDVADDLIEAHRDVSVLMPFLHLPVQSGSDGILKAMNRKHTVDFYLRCLERFQEARPDIVFSSDFIVGFPGETDADFDATLHLVERVGFAQAYSFKYSPRPGTPAAHAPHQIPEDIKNDRLQALQALINKKQLAFNEACVGQRMEILLERPGSKPEQWIGRSPWMQSVHITAPELRLGDWATVTIEAGLGNSLRGHLESPLG